MQCSAVTVGQISFRPFQFLLNFEFFFNQLISFVCQLTSFLLPEDSASTAAAPQNALKISLKSALKSALQRALKSAMQSALQSALKSAL